MKRSIMKPDLRILYPLLALPLLAGVLQHDDTPRFDGEYGLYVTHVADSLRVSWITQTVEPGFLEIVQDGQVRERYQTNAGNVHRVAVWLPDSGTVTLRYGTASEHADVNETVVRLGTPLRPQVSVPDVDSIYIMSDVHGEYDTVTAVLRNAGIIDSAGDWTAGRAHLVIAGDMVDRGRDVTRLLWFLYGLESRAQRAGGQLDILLGNHEVMVMTGDLRYVHPKEKHIAELHGVGYNRMYDPHESVLGRWLASKPAVMRINDVLIAHGGVSADQLGFTLRSFDDSLRVFTSEPVFTHWWDDSFVVKLDSAALARREALLHGERSVFWFRGYARYDTLAAELVDVLRGFDSRLHVIGHTPAPAITGRYNGSIIMVNTMPPGREVLLLVRAVGGYERWRIGTTGPPVLIE